MAQQTNDAGVLPMSQCPQCGGELEPVTYPIGSALNPDQWASVRAGDWCCRSCPDNDRGKNGRCYWWDREVTTPRAASPERGPLTFCEMFHLQEIADELRTVWLANCPGCASLRTQLEGLTDALKRQPCDCGRDVDADQMGGGFAVAEKPCSRCEALAQAAGDPQDGP